MVGATQIDHGRLGSHLDFDAILDARRARGSAQLRAEGQHLGVGAAGRMMDSTPRTDRIGSVVIAAVPPSSGTIPMTVSTAHARG